MAGANRVNAHIIRGLSEGHGAGQSIDAGFTHGIGGRPGMAKQTDRAGNYHGGTLALGFHMAGDGAGQVEAAGEIGAGDILSGRIGGFCHREQGDDAGAGQVRASRPPKRSMVVATALSRVPLSATCRSNIQPS